MGPSNFISRGKCLFPLGDCDKSYTKYVVITEVCTGKPCRLLHGEALPLESCNWAEKYVGFINVMNVMNISYVRNFFLRTSKSTNVLIKI
jgi:hypothetical protein